MALMAVAPEPVASPTWSASCLGVASIAFLDASTAIVQLEAAPEMRGRVLALQAMVFLGSTPIGGPIVGWVSRPVRRPVRDRARRGGRARRRRVGDAEGPPGARRRGRRGLDVAARQTLNAELSR